MEYGNGTVCPPASILRTVREFLPPRALPHYGICGARGGHCRSTTEGCLPMNWRVSTAAGPLPVLAAPSRPPKFRPTRSSFEGSTAVGSNLSRRLAALEHPLLAGAGGPSRCRDALPCSCASLQRGPARFRHDAIDAVANLLDPPSLGVVAGPSGRIDRRLAAGVGGRDAKIPSGCERGDAVVAIAERADVPVARRRAAILRLHNRPGLSGIRAQEAEGEAGIPRRDQVAAAGKVGAGARPAVLVPQQRLDAESRAAVRGAVIVVIRAPLDPAGADDPDAARPDLDTVGAKKEAAAPIGQALALPVQIGPGDRLRPAHHDPVRAVHPLAAEALVLEEVVE